MIFPLFSSKARRDEFMPGVGTAAAVTLVATMSTPSRFLASLCLPFFLAVVVLSLFLSLSGAFSLSSVFLSLFPSHECPISSGLLIILPELPEDRIVTGVVGAWRLLVPQQESGNPTPVQLRWMQARAHTGLPRRRRPPT